MKMKKCYLLKRIIMLTVIQILVFVLPLQAANRNDFLFNLKDTFNNSVVDKFSVNTSIAIIICTALLGLFLFYNSREKNIRRSARKLRQIKEHRQMLVSKQAAGQRRKWFRLATRAEFKWMPVDQLSQARHNRYTVDRLIDISGGGICFSTDKILKPGNQIKIIISTGQGDPINMNGQVIRVSRDNDSYKVAVEFIDIRAGQQDRIVTWILARQRKAIHEKKPAKNKLGNHD